MNQNNIINPLLNQNYTYYNMNINNNFPNQNFNQINQFQQNNMQFGMMNQMNKMNQINQMNPMNQMNQMNQINQMNQMNNNINLEDEIIKNNQNLNYKKFYINLDQINLINSIIDFYKKNHKEYMNFNEKVQIMNLINHLNPNLSVIKETHNDDPLHYIKDDKIIIKFINRDKVLYNVQIPVSINKKDLYSIAEKYKSCYFTNFLLIHSNSILNKDESSIKCISNDDTIIIVEDRYYQDNSYYNSLIKNNNFEDMINIRLSGSINDSLYFPLDITFSEMLKTIYFKFDRDNRDFLIDYYCEKVNDKIKEIFGNRKVVYITARDGGGILGGFHSIYGKKINLYFHNYTINIGILNSNKKLIEYIKCLVCDYRKKVRKLYIEGKELNIEEEKSLLSFGIKEDCYNCKVEFNEKKNNEL